MRISHRADTFNERYSNTRFYASPGGIVNPSGLNRATINGVSDQPYEACSWPDEDDWKNQAAWEERPDTWYRENMGLEYIGSGVITYVHSSNIPPPDLGIEDYIDYEEDFDGS